MYFFVGRSDAWYGILEYYSGNGTALAVGNEIYDAGASGATAYGSTTFKATIEKVFPSYVLVSAPNPISANPTPGNVLKGYASGSDTGAEALCGVYRKADENSAPAPLDNQEEKFRIYKELIAAKRVESSNVISVIPRLNWNTALNPTFDMYKPDYSAAPSTGGTAKQTTNNKNSLGEAKLL